MLNKSNGENNGAGNRMVRPIPFKAHKVKWLAAELIEDKFENHYGAEVRRLNVLEQQYFELKSTKASRSESMALSREILKSANSVALYETYFNGIGDISEDQLEFNPDSKLGRLIVSDFGSVENFQNAFAEIFRSEIKDTSWVVLAWSEIVGQLAVLPVRDDANMVFGLQPLLSIDLPFNASKTEFERDEYISSFLQSVHWGRVSDKLDAIVQRGWSSSVVGTVDSITVNELKNLAEQQSDYPLVLDVRHTDDCERYRHRITETQWRDSFDVSSWASELPKDRPIVVYCMYGFWVSQDVATELRAQGHNARSLVGGINSWRAMGYDTTNM